MDTSAADGGASALLDGAERSHASSLRRAGDTGAGAAGTPSTGTPDTQRLLTRLGFPAAGGRLATANGWSTARLGGGGNPADAANSIAGASGGGSSSTDSEQNTAGATPAASGGGDLPAGGLRVKLAPAAFHEDEFELYKAYQAAIHDRSPTSYTPAAYNNFLVESPLPPPSDSWASSGDSSDSNDDPPAPAPPCGYGTFHARYELNGTLIAVAVLDILPRCVSSVYLFYSPAYGHLSLGSLSALHEIAHTASLTPTCPDLRYYYMGYYIHTCPKMSYKGSYAPSELLCEATQTWVPLSDAVARLLPGGRAPVEVRPAVARDAEPNCGARFHIDADSDCNRNRESDRDDDSDGDDCGYSDRHSSRGPAAAHTSGGGGGGGGGNGHGDATAVVRLAPPGVPAVPTPAVDDATLDDVAVMLFMRGGCVRLRLGEVEAWVSAAAASSSSSSERSATDRRRLRRGGGSNGSDAGGGGGGGDGASDPAAVAARAAVADLRRRVAAFAATAGVAVAAAAAYVLEVGW